MNLKFTNYSFSLSKNRGMDIRTKQIVTLETIQNQIGNLTSPHVGSGLFLLLHLYFPFSSIYNFLAQPLVLHYLPGFFGLSKFDSVNPIYWKGCNYRGINNIKYDFTLTLNIGDNLKSTKTNNKTSQDFIDSISKFIGASLGFKYIG